MLDKWIYGQVGRISPEAPVPVIDQESVKTNAGGAGNLAINLTSLQNHVEIYGALAKDDAMQIVLDHLGLNGVIERISYDHSVTTTKTRLVSNTGHHIARLDNESKYYNTTPTSSILNNLSEDDLVCISDYNKGVVSKAAVHKICKVAKKVLVDPKQDPEVYKGAFLVKPNMKEYKSWFGDFRKETALLKMKKYKWKWLVVTDSSNGMHVLNDEGYYKTIKEEVREVADVTGAGDTVLAVLAHFINKGFDVFQAAEFACYAAARTVEKQGVVPVTLEDIDRGIIFTNGVFDILHTGHLELLKEARSIGNKLIVGINSDASVKRLKGESRPINDENKRKEQLEILPWVDKVYIFNTDTPYELIKELRPDTIVKGGDYTPETVVGNDLAEVYIVPTKKGYSTTNIIKESHDKT